MMAFKLETSLWPMVLFGPRASWAMAMWQATMLGKFRNSQSG